MVETLYGASSASTAIARGVLIIGVASGPLLPDAARLPTVTADG